MKLILEVLTPTRVVLKEEVDEITIPTIEGEISILPNHVNLLTKIVHGEMQIIRNGKSEPFAVTGGFLEVSDNHVNILADEAVHANDIEVSKVQEAMERAGKAMKEKQSEKDLEELQDQIRVAALQLKVARKHRHTRTS